MARAKRKPVIVETLEAPTPEQLAQGGYERGFAMHVETATTALVHISAHSPIQRWKRAKRLSDSQIAAIALCEALWAKCGLRQRVTANYGERMQTGCDNEWLANIEIDARRRLKRIEAYIVPWQWEVFENVCRFDESSGTVGAALGFNGSKATMAATLMLVRIVADIIAREERLA